MTLEKQLGRDHDFTTSGPPREQSNSPHNGFQLKRNICEGLYPALDATWTNPAVSHKQDAFNSIQRDPTQPKIIITQALCLTI